MIIRTGGIYDHERYGLVLVTGVGEMYEAWNPNGNISGGDGDVIVFFHRGIDEHIGSNATLTDQRVDEFEKEAEFIRRCKGYDGEAD